MAERQTGEITGTAKTFSHAALTLFIVCALALPGRAHARSVETVLRSTAIYGANGLAIDKDDHLVIAAINPKAVLVMDTDTGKILTKYTDPLITGPDDVSIGMNADYSASKHGVIGLTKTLALELGLLRMDGITANSICPGSTATPMISAITEHMRPLTGESPETFIQERIASKNIQQRLLAPEEIAYMAVYLASDEARGVTGQALNVCAGTVLY